MKSFSEFSQPLQEKNVPDNPALWDKAIAKAKAKFDVYPSAYANAWAAKWYKGEGGTWSVKKEEVEEKSLHPDLHKIVKTKDGYQLMMYSASAGKFVAQGKPQSTERKAEKAALVFASVNKEEVEIDEAMTPVDALIKKGKYLGDFEGATYYEMLGRIYAVRGAMLTNHGKVNGPSVKRFKKSLRKAIGLDESLMDQEREDKPLIKWFDAFEKELKKAGGKYKDIDPTDMLKLYYKGKNPKAAVKELL